jgi:hypothetical protein
MHDPIVVTPNHQLLIQQTRACRTASLDGTGEADGMPTIVEAHSNPQRRDVAAMAHHVEHKAIKWTEAARHLERVDQFERAGNLHGDGLDAGLAKLNVETEPFSAVPCKFDEALRLERAFKDEARAFMGHRCSIGFSARACDRTGIADGLTPKKASRFTVSRTEINQMYLSTVQCASALVKLEFCL